MKQVPRAIFFDVDGVLIDSLPQHLQVCRDKAEEFGLALKIPSVAEFRQLIANGVKVSPMLDFFLAVGFPRPYAERAVRDYEREFMARYRPQLFNDVPLMLSTLKGVGLTLGLVTSNTRSNVTPALGTAMQYFHPASIFFVDDYSRSMTKAECLAKGAADLSLQPSACVYVGDQPTDEAAASTAHFRFLGVTYGWGIVAGSSRSQMAFSVLDIPRKLAAMQMAA